LCGPLLLLLLLNFLQSLLVGVLMSQEMCLAEVLELLCLLLLCLLLQEGCREGVKQPIRTIELALLCSAPAFRDVRPGGEHFCQLGEERPRLGNIGMRSSEKRTQLLWRKVYTKQDLNRNAQVDRRIWVICTRLGPAPRIKTKVLAVKFPSMQQDLLESSGYGTSKCWISSKSMITEA
jgi:hypothetical protein